MSKVQKKVDKGGKHNDLQPYEILLNHHPTDGLLIAESIIDSSIEKMHHMMYLKTLEEKLKPHTVKLLKSQLIIQCSFNCMVPDRKVDD